jgi:hypothetical protein
MFQTRAPIRQQTTEAVRMDRRFQATAREVVGSIYGRGTASSLFKRAPNGSGGPASGASGEDPRCLPNRRR